MKIILSRKGFDSARGNQPNPIMPDGKTLLSLPIPDNYGNNSFESLFWGGMNYYEIIHSLKPSTHLKAEDCCHLDPDLRKEVKKRKPGWKPAFGQSDIALKHLQKNGVAKDDLFLFFGWFKQTKVVNGKLVYDKDAKDLHIIYAYMQIGEIINPKDNPYDWLRDHPHIGDKKHRKNDHNAIFLPSDKLTVIPNLDRKGCDVLSYHPDRVLTTKKEGMSKRFWDMPLFFKDVKITYHPHPWEENDCFKSAGRGQEFVIDVDASPESSSKILNWVEWIIKND